MHFSFISIFRACLDVLFPRQCIGCRMEATTLCGECKKALPRRDLHEALGNIVPLFSYENLVVKQAIWALKYKNNHEISEFFGDALSERIRAYVKNFPASYTASAPPVIIPIPLSRRRRWRRGYNQMERVARNIARADHTRHFDVHTNVLVKKLHTKSQTEIKNRKERLANVRGSFYVRNPHLVDGRIVIVVDDVVTTGGTLREAMRVLHGVGAKKVIGFALAH